MAMNEAKLKPVSEPYSLFFCKYDVNFYKFQVRKVFYSLF